MKLSKKRILIAIDWYLPSFKAGGPIMSVHNLVNILIQYAKIDIVCGTTDIDGTKVDHHPYDRWISKNDGLRIRYCSDTAVESWKKILNEERYDKVYLNGIFSLPFTINIIRAATRENIIIAARGMLSKGALQSKTIKKRVFLSVLKISGLLKQVTFQASTEQEKQEIKAIFPKNQIKIARNLPRTLHKQAVEQLPYPSFAAAGRVSPVKNHDFAIAVLPSGSHFYLYGNIEDKAYQQQCIKTAQQNNIHLHFDGEYSPESFEQLISKHHFLLMPTKNENFGHAIIESMQCGLVPIISDQTPWKNLMQQKIGFDMPLDAERWKTRLKEICQLPENEMKIWSQNAIAFSKKITLDEEAIKSNLELFDLT